jgi:hypothetical protein
VLCVSEGYASTFAYESKVSEVLTTADGSALSVDCMRSYTDEADDKAAAMMAEIVTELEATQCGDVVAEQTYLTVFSALDDQVPLGISPISAYGYRLRHILGRKVFTPVFCTRDLFTNCLLKGAHRIFELHAMIDRLMREGFGLCSALHRYLIHAEK